MSQQSVNDPPTPSVIPPYFGYDQGETNHPTGQQGGNWGGNRGQLGGNMGFRGGWGRGGGQRGGVCFVCGSSEHWRNECPSQQGGGQFTGPPAGGWGPRRGGPGGRSRGPYTSRYSGQQHPSPANLQAPMHPTWGSEGDAGDCWRGPQRTTVRGMAEPLMEIVVDSKPLRALVDTRATYSTETRGTITDKDLSDKTVGVMGFSGGLEHWPKKKKIIIIIINRPGCESKPDTLISILLECSCTSAGKRSAYQIGSQYFMLTTRGHSDFSRWYTGWLLTDCPHRLQTECSVRRTIKGGSWHLLGRIRHFPIPNECSGKSCLAFTYRDRQYSYNRLPQGFILSPGIFNQILKNYWQNAHFPRLCLDNVCWWPVARCHNKWRVPTGD